MFEKLRFTWLHIFALVAVICLAYLSFSGMMYWTTDLTASLIIAALTLAINISLLFIIQNKKATDVYLAKNIKRERILVALTTIVYLVSFIPATAFFHTHSSNSNISENFKQALEGADKLFDDYESYANARINEYESQLNDQITDSRYGQLQRDNMVQTLRTALLPSAFYKLRKEASDWIDKSKDMGSTWNVFLIGNINYIDSTVASWNDTLVCISNVSMINEYVYVTEGRNIYFEGSSANYNKSHECFEEIRKQTMFNISSVSDSYSEPFEVVVMVVLYIMLLSPYFFQERYPKSRYRLLLPPKKIKGAVADDNGGVWILTEKFPFKNNTQCDKKAESKVNEKSNKDKYTPYR